MENRITIESVIHAPVEMVWDVFTNPEHIVKWNQASDDWHTPHATNDLKVGGRFSSRMEAKDRSAGFDFSGVYDDVVLNERIAYTMDDGRKVDVLFKDQNGTTHIVETFDPESENPPEFQKAGWQAILDNFKKYIEELR